VSNFFFSLILQHIKKIKKIAISFYYFSKYISSIKNKKKKRKEKSKKKNRSKRRLLDSAAKKLNKGKLDQINSELAQI